MLKWYLLSRRRNLQLREGKRRHVTNWRNESWPGVVFVLRANCAQNQTSFQHFQTLTSMLSNSCQQVSLCICVGKNQTSQMVANFSTCDLTAAPLISLSLNILMAPKFRLFSVDTCSDSWYEVHHLSAIPRKKTPGMRKVVTRAMSTMFLSSTEFTKRAQLTHSDLGPVSSILGWRTKLFSTFTVF